MVFRRGSNKQQIALGPELGRGGEACVYEVSHDLVAKIYHRPTVKHEQKLAVMIDNPPDDPMIQKGHISIAWPIDLLYESDTRSRFAGYLMPRVTDMISITEFYNPKARRMQCPLFSYLYLYRTAHNLAAAFRALHDRGYVIGDVNGRNILVAETALIAIVDTDSFQVCDTQNRSIYRCPVGTDEFTPTELQGKDFSQIERTTEHDCFGLAVLIFKLLMLGFHPFDGKYQGIGEQPTIEERISRGYFPYSKGRVPTEPPPIALDFNVLPPKIQSLFIRCFESGHSDSQMRPSTWIWQEALLEAESNLSECSTNSQHLYSNHLKSCPWCELTKKRNGRDPFPSGQPSGGQKPLPPPIPATPTAPSHRTKHNLWALTALVFALLAFIPALRLWASLLAIMLGVTSRLWKRSYAKRGKWAAISAMAIGTLMVISVLLSYTNTLWQDKRNSKPATTHGYLDLQSVVPWAYVYIDNQRVATAPTSESIKVKPGKRHIRLENPETEGIWQEYHDFKQGEKYVLPAIDLRTYAYLKVESVKPWAHVYVDDERIATTPINDTLKIVTGRHMIKVENPETEGVWQEEHIFKRGEIYSLPALDLRTYASLKIDSVVPWADVFVDSQRVARTPVEKAITVLTGKHQIKLLNPDTGGVWQKEHRFRKGEIYTLPAIDLRTYAYLKVQSVKPWADVYIDGQKVDTTPTTEPIKVETGRHHIKLANSEIGESWEEYHDFRKDEIYVLPPVDLRNYAYLKMQSVKPWAHVYIDGKKVGTTPISSPIRVSIGNHSIMLENPITGKKWQKQHDFRKGETYSLPEVDLR